MLIRSLAAELCNSFVARALRRKESQRKKIKKLRGPLRLCANDITLIFDQRQLLEVPPLSKDFPLHKLLLLFA